MEQTNFLWHYADDGGAARTRVGLKRIQNHGPMFGYFPNPSKTWLVVKEAHLDRATEMFSDIKISVEGRKYLGSFIGTEDGKAKFVGEVNVKTPPRLEVTHEEKRTPVVQ